MTTKSFIFLFLFTSSGLAQMTEHYSSSTNDLVYNVSTGKYKYLTKKTGNILTILDLKTKQNISSINVTAEYYGVGPIIPDLDKNGNDEIIVLNLPNGTSDVYAQIIDIKSSKVVKEFKKTSWYLYPYCIIGEGNEYILWYKVIQQLHHTHMNGLCMTWA